MGQRWVGNGGKDGTAWGLGRRQVEEERKKKMKGRREGWWLWSASGHGRQLGSVRVEEERKKSKGEMMKLK